MKLATADLVPTNTKFRTAYPSFTGPDIDDPFPGAVRVLADGMPTRHLGRGCPTKDTS